MGGRHPGYYFKTETSDLVKSDIVCPKSYSNDSINIGRGGAVAELVSSDGIVLCGGRDKMNEVMDTCSKYNMREHMWEEHSQLLVPREEAASAVLAGQVQYYFLALIHFISPLLSVFLRCMSLVVLWMENMYEIVRNTVAMNGPMDQICPRVEHGKCIKKRAFFDSSLIDTLIVVQVLCSGFG